MKFTTRLYLEAMLKMSGPILFFPSIPSWRDQGQIEVLYIAIILQYNNNNNNNNNNEMESAWFKSYKG
jgi:hypothetical protein